MVTPGTATRVSHAHSHSLPSKGFLWEARLGRNHDLKPRCQNRGSNVHSPPYMELMLSRKKAVILTRSSCGETKRDLRMSIKWRLTTGSHAHVICVNDDWLGSLEYVALAIIAAPGLPSSRWRYSTLFGPVPNHTHMQILEVLSRGIHRYPPLPLLR